MDAMLIRWPTLVNIHILHLEKVSYHEHCYTYASWNIIKSQCSFGYRHCSLRTVERDNVMSTDTQVWNVVQTTEPNIPANVVRVTQFDNSGT